MGPTLLLGREKVGVKKPAPSPATRRGRISGCPVCIERWLANSSSKACLESSRSQVMEKAGLVCLTCGCISLLSRVVLSPPMLGPVTTQSR